MSEGNFDGQPQEEQIDLSSLSVLVAEDELAMRVAYKRALQLMGVTTFYLTENPANAKRTYEELAKEGRAPNVLFTDFHMPGGSGIELLGSLRELDPHIEGILSTSMFPDELKEKNPQNLQFEYVSKTPHMVDDMKRALSQTARNIQARVQLQTP